MKSRSALFTLLIFLMLVFAACGGAPVERPMAEEDVEPSVFADSIEPPAAVEGEIAPQLEAPAAPLPTEAVYEVTDPSGESTLIERSNRMIIKNADIRLLVKDTDVAIDRATQVISDAGGYIVSSRVWYEDYFGNSLKYATMTIGVPVNAFERTLVRLRDLAVRVVDEVASGEDVTDQYVDLQSELTNLEATRARILEFLEDAKTVDEALRINQELSNIEAQIEQIKGRMNYLTDRSAFSTITINFEPEFPILTPTPTATPLPTATPVPWKPGDTFEDAKSTVIVAYQGMASFLIWLVVAILPILLPIVLIGWVFWKLMKRNTTRVVAEKDRDNP